MNKSSTTILVSSCDKYSDLWIPYFNLSKIFWADCNYEYLLISESKELVVQNVTSLKLGNGKDWSALLLDALECVKTDTVILTLEDFFLRDHVDNLRIEYLLELFYKNSMNMLRLNPRPKPNIKSDWSNEIGVIGKHEKYRASTQAAIWRVEILKSIIQKGESAWEFEINGTQRSKEMDGFYCVYKPALPYFHHVIERGKWFPWDALRFKYMDIGVDLNCRSVMSFTETSLWLTKKLLSVIKSKFL